MMLPQQETGVQPSDSTQASKGSKQKSNVGAASLTSSNGGVATEQQAQRCPRCDSLNTKFCYFNNYSMSQPRHFCKNCRRYWTKGGALRNVPVGGGCRKNKRLKHRDPSYLTAFGEADASGPSHILASISGCGLAGFNPSASSLIQDLAREGHRQFAISRFPGMHLYDKRFITDNEQSHSGGTPTQDLFALGPGSVSSSGHLLSPFDQSTFPCLSNYLKSDSQPLLFQPHQLPHELAPFYDSISLTPTILAPQLEQFDAVGGSQSSQHDSANGMASSVGGIESQLTLIHENVQLNGVPASHHEMRSHEDQAQQAGLASAIREEFDEENVEMNMAKNNGRAIVSSISDWDTGVRSALVQHRMVTSDSEAMFSMPNQVSESSLWNASWPEMHAALAGSAAAAAGAMLH